MLQRDLGAVWAGTARRRILDLVDGGGVRCGRGELARARAARGKRVYDMGAVKVWQRGNHAGNAALLVGLDHYGGMFDLHDVYAAAAGSRRGGWRWWC